MARLVDMERDIKKMIEKDPSDPDIFNKVYDLVYWYLRRKKFLNTAEEAAEVAHNLAVDLYMKLYNGNPVYSWLGYISKASIGYVRKYREATAPQIFDTTDNPQLADAIVKMSSSSADSYALDFVHADNYEYIDNLEHIVDEVMDNIKYYPYTPEWYNLKISVLLSLANGQHVCYRLSEADRMYLGFIIVQVSDKFVKDFKIETTTEESLSSLQMFALESLGYEGDTND